MTIPTRNGPPKSGTLDPGAIRALVDRVWDESIVPALVEYIRIPNKSPHFDEQWAEHGHMDRAVELIADWCAARRIAGLELEVVRLEGRTPLIYMEIPGTIDATVVLYGHLDKQPEMVGWSEEIPHDFLDPDFARRQEFPHWKIAAIIVTLVVSTTMWAMITAITS